jgi:hypothetical protein
MSMVRYANHGGNSNIIAYGVTPDSITVQFGDGAVYLYNYESAGPTNVERMKSLAREGQGLSSFINKDVKDQYAQRLR